MRFQINASNLGYYEVDWGTPLSIKVLNDRDCLSYSKEYLQDQKPNKSPGASWAIPVSPPSAASTSRAGVRIRLRTTPFGNRHIGATAGHPQV